MCSSVNRNKNRIRSWDDAIADYTAELAKLDQNGDRAKELKQGIRIFEAAKKRGDRWPGGEESNV